MEKHPMLVGQDGNTPWTDLEIQYDPITIPADFFAKTDKLIPKFIRNFKTPRIAKTVLGVKKRSHTSRFQNLLQNNIIECDTDITRHMSQWTRSQSPQIHPYIYNELIFNKGAKTIQQGKESCWFCFLKWCSDNRIVICKRIKLTLKPHHKQKLKHIKDLNRRAKDLHVRAKT